jgi:hypothetical protein
MGSALADLQILTSLPKIINGEDTNIEDFFEHSQVSDHLILYREKNFAMKRILHFGKKHMLNHRFIIKSEKDKTRLLLHVRWIEKTRKHLIGFVEELPSGK